MPDTPAPRTFEEFWPYYVSQHLHPVNRALHCTGTGIGLLCTAVSPIFPPALLAAPVWGYGLSWVGHFLFERNLPASWYSAQHFKWSYRGDMRMLRLSLQGRMGPELERARRQFPEVAADKGTPPKATVIA